jgi:hypothetical protein
MTDEEMGFLDPEYAHVWGHIYFPIMQGDFGDVGHLHEKIRDLSDTICGAINSRVLGLGQPKTFSIHIGKTRDGVTQGILLNKGQIDPLKYENMIYRWLKIKMPMFQDILPTVQVELVRFENALYKVTIRVTLPDNCRPCFTEYRSDKPQVWIRQPCLRTIRPKNEYFDRLFPKRPIFTISPDLPPTSARYQAYHLSREARALYILALYCISCIITASIWVSQAGQKPFEAIGFHILALLLSSVHVVVMLLASIVRPYLCKSITDVCLIWITVNLSLLGAKGDFPSFITGLVFLFLGIASSYGLTIHGGLYLNVPRV